ncbi:MAG TPA: hypothetical protein VKK79_06810 [Candidatus Lokiarchaeia archaeon]|nr:hypothetical protein [Candidatus Lokiarchaeia archaeon]
MKDLRIVENPKRRHSLEERVICMGKHEVSNAYTDYASIQAITEI